MVSVTRTPRRLGAVLARWMGLDANPLRRRTDRVETWVRLALVVAFLVASPLAALGLGRLTSEASASAARAQAATERQVTAVLLKRASRTPDDSLYAAAEFVYAPARWTAPDGQRRVGEAPAPVGSAAGRRVSIWVDTAGAGLPAHRGGPDRQPGRRRRGAHPGRAGHSAAHRPVADQAIAGPAPDRGLGRGMVFRRATVD